MMRINDNKIVRVGLLVFFLATLPAFSQINPQGIAPGAHEKVESPSIMQFPMTKSKEILYHEDKEGFNDGVPYRVAVSIPIYTNFFDLGQWFEQADGSRFYRAVISSAGAKALSLAFDQFYLPKQAQLFFYSPEKDHIYGGYTYEDNHESLMFPGPIIQGDVVIVEYLEVGEVLDSPKLHIMELAYFYRDAFLKNNSIGASDDCHINVNCEEGADWQDQKRSVARILTKVGNSYGFCSGALINNTALDGTPYFITAYHCGGTASVEDRNLWQFRFNFERPGCEDIGTPPTRTITGASLVAHTPMEEGSDMQLLVLNFTPPPSFNPFYSGWDRSVVPAQNGVAIHHPAGDVKKISTFSSTAASVPNAVVSNIAMAPHSTWNIRFVETENGHGVTQGGSSGSPMFNENGLLVGTLTGGSSSCTNLNGSNLYGKLNYHWDQHGPDPLQQLMPWLDPMDTRQATMHGMDVFPFPVPENLTVELQPDMSVTLRWDEPDYSGADNWYSYATNYTSLRNDTPERATRFNISGNFVSDTFYIKRISHLFWEHPQVLWGENDQFLFRIYDQNGSGLLYESDVLTAIRFFTEFRPVEHELPNPLGVTNSFFVSIVPIQGGQPSSLAQEVFLTPNSYFGSQGDWNILEQEGRYFELMTFVYGSDELHSNNLKKLASASEADTEFKYHRFTDPDANLKALGLIQSYNIYRNNTHIATISANEPLQYTDDLGLQENEQYQYHITAVYNFNPANPAAPDFESLPSVQQNIIIAFSQIQVNSNPAEAGEVSGEGRFAAGATTTLKASPIKGYDFAGWISDGEVLSTDTVFELVVPIGDLSLVANFNPTDYYLIVDAYPPGSGTFTIQPHHQNSLYAYGSQIQLEAASGPGFEFLNWRNEGSVFSADNPLSFSMPASDITLTARFKTEEAETYSLSISSEPAGIMPEVRGAGEYLQGEIITIVAGEVEGYSFVSWQTDDQEALPQDQQAAVSTIAIPDRDIRLTAIYMQAAFNLTTVVVPENAGNIQTDPQQDAFSFGEMFTAEAISVDGFAFVNWTIDGQIVGEDPVLTWEFPAHDMILQANFEPLQYVLEIEITPQNGGEVFVSPIRQTYQVGDQLLLTAVPAENYQFANYTLQEEEIGTDEVLVFTMPAHDATVTANFFFATSVAQFSNTDQIKVYPNPARGILNIASSEPIAEIWITDVSGRIIYHNKQLGNNHQIISDVWHPGIYVVRVMTIDRITERKLIISR